MALKILNYSKLKNDMYRLSLSNGKVIDLYEDVILEYELLYTKKIEDLDDILNYNSLWEAYYKGIKYLSRGQRTKYELRGYLFKYYDKQMIDFAMEMIEKKGYLNDDSLVESYAKDQLLLTKNGYFKIVDDLEKKGINREVVCDYLNTIDKNIWIERANKIADKIVKNNKKYGYKILKEKIAYDLTRMGYSKEIIMNILYNIKIEKDDSLLEKNCDIFYKRYSKKYKGSTLKSKILATLISKGFRYDDSLKMIEKKYDE